MPLVRTTNGTEIFYETFGDADRPPLVLIQGLSAQMLGWRRELCTELAAAGYHVIRFDNRDVGLSQKFPELEYSITDMAGDVVGLLDVLGIDQAHIVGQSMGGMIAQELAIHHPDRILSLALIYTAASASWISAEVADRPEQARPASREEAVQAYLESESYCASTAYKQDTVWLSELGGLMFDRDPDQTGVERQMNAIAHWPDRSTDIESIDVPTTVLVGDSDRLIDPRASADLHRRISSSLYRVFPGVGHEIPAVLIEDFVAEVSRNAHRRRVDAATASASA